MTRRVAFTPAQMYAVVADVERYPEFLPLCETLVVKSREEGSTHSTLVATMTVGYGAIRESFTSRVTLRPERHEVDVVKIEGTRKNEHAVFHRRSRTLVVADRIVGAPVFL